MANLGVVNTGAQHWERSLSWFAKDHRVADAAFDEAQFREGLRAFDRIAAKFPAAVFLHLPMAEEARSQAWLRRSPRIREHLRALGGRYRDGMRECGLEGSDYHRHDPRPNANGYQKIRRCVAQIVRGLRTT